MATRLLPAFGSLLEVYTVDWTVHGDAGAPGVVRNLTVVSVSETTVSLWWRAPADSGGRSDVVYTVHCDSCDDKLVLYRPRQAHLNDTACVRC